MHFDKAAVEHALDHVAKIADAERFATLTRGVAMLEPDVAARAVLVMLLPELAGAEALSLADLPLSDVTVQPVNGQPLNKLAADDVAKHPLAALVKPTLGATLGRRLRFGAAREDLLPHEIVPQVLEIVRGAPGETWAVLTFAYSASGAHGAATFGRKGTHPVVRHTATGVHTLTEIGVVAYALTLACAEPEPDAIAVPLAVAPEAVSPETLH